MKELNIEIITPSKVAFSGMVKSLSIPGTAGNFQVLFNHAPLLSTFEIGRIKIVNLNDKELEFATSGGSVEVLTNKILILADSLEAKDEIDIQRAESSFQRAKDRLTKKNKEKIDEIRAEASLQRALNRLKFAK
jgi:F-type H+-transporting ATPase subunit epsilon